MERPRNGRVLLLTNFTATLQWDSVNISKCNFINQIVNCSYLNTSLKIITSHKYPYQVILENLKPSTKYICYSVFFNNESYSEKSDEIKFWTKSTSNFTVLLLLVLNIESCENFM